MSSTKSGSHTVEFRGDKDLTLVGDEVEPRVASAAQHPTILMLHGGGQNRYSWKNTGQVLADQGLPRDRPRRPRARRDSDPAPNGEQYRGGADQDVLNVLDQDR